MNSTFFQRKYLQLSSLFSEISTANFTVLSPRHFQFFKQNAFVLTKNKFYAENYGSLPLMIDTGSRKTFNAELRAFRVHSSDLAANLKLKGKTKEN